MYYAFQGVDNARLKISGHHFYLDGIRVFLSGINQAWVNYGYDFGNNQYQQRRAKYEDTLDKVRAAGGNSVRMLFFLVFVHYAQRTNTYKMCYCFLIFNQFQPFFLKIYCY